MTGNETENGLREAGSAAADPLRKLRNFGLRRFLGGLTLIGGLGICGFAVAVAGRGGLSAMGSTVSPRPGLLLVSLALSAFDIALGGFRIHVLARRLAPAVRLSACLRADLANKCLAGLTPGQTGGGAAQLYVLSRAGLPLPAGVAVGTLNFLVSTLSLTVLGAALMPFLAEQFPTWLRGWTNATLLLFLALVVLGVVLLAKPRSRRRPRPNPEGRIRRLLSRTRGFVRRSLDTARALIRREPGAVLALFPITFGIIVVKCAYTFALFRAFEPVGHWGELFSVLLIFFLSLFFVPTPGASGVVEASATAFLATSLGMAAAVAFVLYWRVLTLYLPLIAGGFVLLHQLGRDSGRFARGESGSGGGPWLDSPKTGS